MIAYLKGTILKKTEKGIILDTGNIGYLVYVPVTLLANLHADPNTTIQNHPIELFIHSNIREDAFDLYGFNSYNDLAFFKTLISVTGIGPKSALEILNNDVNTIKIAILNEDSAYLCRTPGIGQKTAKRLILELKNKIEIEDISGLENSHDPGKFRSNSEPHPDAIDALLRLGYQRHQVTKTLRNMPVEIIEAEEVITYFLKNI